MLRAAFFTVVFCTCGAAFAGPGEFQGELEALGFEYRSAKAKGELQTAIKTLRQIVSLVPEDTDWRLRLAEDLLRAGRVKEARAEFTEVLTIEPEYLQACIGIARTHAVNGRFFSAKTEMLKAAKRGYSVARMMRARELKECFKDCKFALDLLDADRPQIVHVRDPFENPLQRKTTDDDEKKKKKEEKPGPRKLSAKEQERIASEVKRKLVAAQDVLIRGDSEKALKLYKEIAAAYARIKAFTGERHAGTLEETYRIAQEMLYPRIEKLFREQTVENGEDLLEKLTQSVEKRDMKEAHRLNRELLEVVKKALESRDILLKGPMAAIDTARARVYKTVEIIEEFDREVRPKLAFRGTITGKLCAGRALVFVDIRLPEGTRRLVVGESDKVAPLAGLRVVEIGDDVVCLNYRGVKVKIETAATGDRTQGMGFRE
jgi:tetratricopeptide (TPR) repeat protein